MSIQDPSDRDPPDGTAPERALNLDVNAKAYVVADSFGDKIRDAIAEQLSGAQARLLAEANLRIETLEKELAEMHQGTAVQAHLYSELAQSAATFEGRMRAAERKLQQVLEVLR